jgi:cell division septation protein DedD
MGEIQDTEITLGTGKLLGIFFGLVIICAIFFGLGFSMGRSSVKSTLTMEEVPTASQTIAGNSGQKNGAGTPDKVAMVQESAANQTVDDAAKQAPVVTSPAGQSNTPSPEMVKGSSLLPNGNYAVQVAAVSKQEDADALVDALKRKAYPVFIAGATSDKLFHVQVGPYADIKDAEAMKAKLTGDGYNPIVKR